MGDFETGEKYAKHLDVSFTSLYIISKNSIIVFLFYFLDKETSGSYVPWYQTSSGVIFSPSWID